jgi:hypothetical protein
MPIELTQTYVKPPGVLTQEMVDGGLVLLHVDSGQHFGLDPLGKMAWKSLSSGETLAATCDHLLSVFDVSPEQLRSDLTVLINELTSNGLLEISAP